MSPTGAVPKEYGEGYFAKYLDKNILGIPRGSRPFLYAFWLRYLVRSCPAQASVLEVGCGLGYFAARLSRVFSTVGLDISSSALGYARMHMGFKPVVCGTAESLPFGSNNFDVVVALDVVEHLKNPHYFFREAQRVLKDDGLMVVSTPNPQSLGAKKGVNWFANRDETHISIRPMSEWRLAFTEAGFLVNKDGTDLLWDPPYVSWIPTGIQRAACISAQWVMTWAFGFLPWKSGENYVAILRKGPRL